MSHVETCQMGSIEVETICEGFAPLALAGEVPGRDVDWAGERERHPWAFHGDDAWAWHVHAFVVRTSSSTVVVDTGVGAFGPYAPWGSHDPDAWASIDTGEVDHVVLTHLHADHAGGSMDGGEPRFPNATYHVHPGDWAAFAGSDDYVAREAMVPLAHLGILDLEPLDHDVVRGVGLLHSPGHTPGHRSVLLRDGEDALLLTGDLLHLPVQVAHPDWASDHDDDPMLGSAARRFLLWRAADRGWKVGVSHFSRPFGAAGADGWHDG